jgi:hypothetical protein
METTLIQSKSKEFVQGDNRVQETILIVLVFIIVFFLIAAFTDVLRDTVKKNKLFDQNKKTEKTKTPAEQVVLPIPTRNEPTHASPTHELQWLLVKAGYNYVPINGVWGSIYENSHKGMRAFEADFGIPFQYSIPNAIPVVRNAMKQKGLLGYSRYKIKAV